MIVGFCGETRQQFEATLRLLETVRYDQVFAAAYSVRPGTPATKLADDVPPAEKRARLNELLALQESIGLERNGAWLGREVEVLVDSVVPPRSHEHEGARRDAPLARDRGHGAVRPDARQQARAPARRDRPRRAVRRRACRPCRAVRLARESRSSDRWLAGASPRSSERARQHALDQSATAARGDCRCHGHRQDGARDPARRVDRGAGETRRDHLGRLAPGLPWPRYRDGEGDGRRTGPRPAPRPRSRRPGRAILGGRFVRHARTALAGIAERDGVAILAGGTGLYLRAIARGLDADALPNDPEVRHGSRRSWQRTALTRSSTGSASSPRRVPVRSTSATRGASSARSRSPSCRVTRACRAPRVRRTRRMARPHGEPGRPRALDRRAGPGPVRCGTHR